MEKTNWTIGQLQFTKQELDRRLAELRAEGNQGYTHYPWEWALVVFPVIGVVAFLLRAHFVRLNKFQELKAHIIMVENSRGYEHTTMMSMPNVRCPDEIKMLPMPPKSRIPRTRLI